MEVSEVWRHPISFEEIEISKGKENAKGLLNRWWTRHTSQRLSRVDAKTEIHAISSQSHSRRLYVAVDKTVRVIVVADGSLETVLKGHKDVIRTMDVSRDGKWLVTGGADKATILWSTSDFSEQLKTKYREPIRCTKFSPTDELLVCSDHEFALWSSESKKLKRSRLPSNVYRIACCSWNSEGTCFALGMCNGLISIRNLEGKEMFHIDRSTYSPICALCFVSDIDYDEDRLVVSDGSGTLSFYTHDGSDYFGNKPLSYAVSSIAEFGKSRKLLLVGGNGGQVNLVSCEGVELAKLCQHDAIIRSVCYHESSEYAIVGTTSGVLAAYQVNYKPLSFVNFDRMAVVRNMTDIHLYQFSSGHEATLKCRDLIEGVGFGKNLLVVRLTQRVIFYKETGEHEPQLQYVISAKISLQRGFRFLLVTNTLLWFESKDCLVTFDFLGETKFKWPLISKISSFCTWPKMEDDEILISLDNGNVYSVNSSHTMPIFMFKHDGVPISLQLSLDGSQLALIDDARILSVYSLSDSKILFQHANASGFVWNTDFSEVFAFSVGTQVVVQDPASKGREISIQGTLSSFKQNVLYCLHGHSMMNYEIKYDGDVSMNKVRDDSFEQPR